MDRFWLLTWTTYGSWLPGDLRGFVSEVRDSSGAKTIHNIPGTPYDADVPDLARYASQSLRGDPVRLVLVQAETMFKEFLETAEHRGWQLLAVAIMANHVHLVVGVSGDPSPRKILGSFKSYASRALKRTPAEPDATGPWWTESGSKRKLPDEDAVLSAVQYVIDQEFPLLIWTAATPELNLPGGRLV